MAYDCQLLSEAGPDFRDMAGDRRAKTSAVGRASGKSGAANQELLGLVQTIFLSGNTGVPSNVMFCGVDETSASSRVCACVGRVLASSTSRSVCLVDANVRLSRLSKLVDVEGEPLSGRAPGLVGEPRKVAESLWLTRVTPPSGRGDDLFCLKSFKKLLDELSGEFDHLLIDAPGALTSGDAAWMGHLTDAAVLVVEAHTTRRVLARRAKDALQAAGVPLIGAVLNNRSFPIPEALYKRL